MEKVGPGGATVPPQKPFEPTPMETDSDSIASSTTQRQDGEVSSIRAPGSGHGNSQGNSAAAEAPNVIQRVPTRTNPQMTILREIAFVFVICNCQVLTQATMAQALGPLHIIGQSFRDPSPGQLSWFIAAFSLTVGTFILPAGRLGDIHGHKLLLIAGYLWLSLWSLVTGFTVYTQNQIFFDFCRAMQGIGCAVLLPNGLALLGTTYPPGRRKNIVFSIFGATAPAGSVIGSTFGSLVAQLAWWPWAFWLMAIVALSLATMGFLAVPNRVNRDDSSSILGAQKFDYWGTALGVAGLILFNVAWNQAPNDGWNAPYVVVFLILGVLLFAAFIWVEGKVDQPLVPMDSIRGKSGLVLGCVLLGWSSFGIWLYYYWQFAEVIQEDTPLNVAAQFVPSVVSGLIAAGCVAVLVSRVRASWLMSIAMVAFCLGNVLFATNQPGRLYWKQAFWSVFITPFGMDISFPAATLILSNLMHKRHQGMAASLVTTAVNYSIAFGLGIAGTVEVHINDGGTTNDDLLKGYRGAWYAGIGLAGLGIVCAGYFVISDYLEEWRGKKNDVERGEKSKLTSVELNKDEQSGTS